MQLSRSLADFLSAGQKRGETARPALVRTLSISLALVLLLVALVASFRDTLLAGAQQIIDLHGDDHASDKCFLYVLNTELA